jgi:hypothetical protein
MPTALNASTKRLRGLRLKYTSKVGKNDDVIDRARRDHTGNEDHFPTPIQNKEE